MSFLKKLISPHTLDDETKTREAKRRKMLEKMAQLG